MTVLDLICYLLAVVLAGLAAIAPTSSPPFDRVRLLSAAFVAFVVPALIHAGQHIH
ncbi:MAG: hypothetical protein JWO67_1270 [Streptosporangiaceae bacterium]|nr:hypothetical protein [Streptosporangiaceae bacterium]